MLASHFMTLNGPSPATFAARRQRVLDALDSAVLFIPVTEEAVFANDVHYAFRPDTNTRYLCGIEEPASLMLSRCGSDCDGFSLFVRPRSEQSETWTGKRVGVDGAKNTFGADHSYPGDVALETLRRTLKHARTLHYGFSRDHNLNREVAEMVHQANAERPREGGAPLVLADAAPLLAEWRQIKCEAELALMRKAAEISAQGHNELLTRAHPGMNEYEVQAIVEYRFRASGCLGPAYGTIAAGGDRATVLHYTRNEFALRDGELLLVDAGGEYGGYCADITRTFPVGKAYTPAQADLYDLVLAAQHAAIDTVAPGTPFDAPHRAALKVLTQGLISFGILSGDADTCIESEAYKPYYMHRTSHWLGMDVHDVGRYRNDSGGPISLVPGMVLTVEPGLYFRADADVPERYRGIGIRIEDDVAVSGNGHVVLSSDAIKERREIESLRARAF